MGKQRYKYSKRIAARFIQHAHYQAFLHNELSVEARQAVLVEAHEKVAALERDMLQRMVLITDVPNLDVPGNLEQLQLWLDENYGPVEMCMIASSYNKGKRARTLQNPNARVRFLNKTDAEKLFDGKELIGLTAKVSIPCPLGVIQGNTTMIHAMPANRYAGMLDSETENFNIEFTATGFGLGYWVPPEQDMYSAFLPDTSDAVQEIAEWLEEVSTNMTPKVQINLKEKFITLSVIVQQGSDCKVQRHVVSFEFKTMTDTIELCNNIHFKDDYFLVFSLKLPPLIRNLPLSHITEIDNFEAGEINDFFNKIQCEIFGRCLGFKLRLSKSDAIRLIQNAETMKKLKDHGLFDESIVSLLDARIVTVVTVNLSDNVHKLQNHLESIHKRNEHLGFLVRALLDKGIINWYDALYNKTRGALNNIIEGNLFDWICNSSVKRSELALKHFLYSYGRTRSPCLFFLELLKEDLEQGTGISLPLYCMYIPKMQITPTRQMVVGLEIETSNRVVRYFVNKEGFKPTSFLRVQITDEDGRKLFLHDGARRLTSKLHNLLVSGVEINGKLYSFLAYSSSQLKECSMWLVNLEYSWSIVKMRQRLGDFSMCRTRSKFAARIGQCFSSTFTGNHIDSRTALTRSLQQGVIQDLFSTYQSKLHSDGTGLIRRSLLDQIVTSIPNCPKDTKDVSIVQIRYGGAKGTLVGWDFENLPIVNQICNFDVCLRGSMIKFDAPYTDIEICSIGKRIPYYLNRNVILLLNALGVPNEVFINMQSQMLNDLDGMLRDNNIALRILPQLSVSDPMVKEILILMLRSGVKPSDDPFLLSCLNAVRLHQLHGLSKKSRIFIKEGAVLMGGIDETGLLPEGCVFFQVDNICEGAPDNNTNTTTYKPYVGPVLVTKHPVMHPGDVRMLLACNIPELRNHRNVILFSQHGDRPEADKMSGSDLDGDEFAVTWDASIFLGEWNMCTKGPDGSVCGKCSVLHMKDIGHDASLLQCVNTPALANEAPTTGEELVALLSVNKAAHTHELIEYFFYFAKNDILGRVGMLWQDHAVIQEKGAVSEACMTLAKVHSCAVDFAKSGIVAKIPEELLLCSKTRRPHWREKKNFPMFHCKKVIGQLYDNVKAAQKSSVLRASCVGIVGRRVDKDGQILCIFDERSTLETLGIVYNQRLGLKAKHGRQNQIHEELHQFASEQRQLFEIEVVALMSKHGIRSEGELFTGCIGKYHKANKHKQHDVSMRVRSDCSKICDTYREKFFTQVCKISKRKFSQKYQQTNCKTILGQYEENDKVKKQATITLVQRISIGELQTNDSEQQLIKEVSDELAGAYYDATYSPKFRWRGEDKYQILFGFPWIVADVLLRA